MIIRGGKIGIAAIKKVAIKWLTPPLIKLITTLIPHKTKRIVDNSFESILEVIAILGFLLVRNSQMR